MNYLVDNYNIDGKAHLCLSGLQQKLVVDVGLLVGQNPEKFKVMMVFTVQDKKSKFTRSLPEVCLHKLSVNVL